MGFDKESILNPSDGSKGIFRKKFSHRRQLSQQELSFGITKTVLCIGWIQTLMLPAGNP